MNKEVSDSWQLHLLPATVAWTIFNVTEKDNYRAAWRTRQGRGAYGWAVPLLSVAGTVLGASLAHGISGRITSI